MKRPQAILPEHVPGVFDDTRIKALVRMGMLPSDADLSIFASEVRRAALIYCADARAPNTNEVHREIADLHKAASQHRYLRVADLLANLTPAARDVVAAGSAGVRDRIALPEPDDLRDVTKRGAGCAAVECLCTFGGRWTDGRKRPNGRRSRTWQPLLRAPAPSRHFGKRDAERHFVTNLRLAVLQATNRQPPATARLVCKGTDATGERVYAASGAFARLVSLALRSVGAAGNHRQADVLAVELINEINRRRRAVEEHRPRSSSDTAS